jgi:hypothetical protein
MGTEGGDNEANPAQASENKWAKKGPYKGHAGLLPQIENEIRDD